jgi:hypothetical protein
MSCLFEKARSISIHVDALRSSLAAQFSLGFGFDLDQHRHGASPFLHCPAFGSLEQHIYVLHWTTVNSVAKYSDLAS